MQIFMQIPYLLYYIFQSSLYIYKHYKMSCLFNSLSYFINDDSFKIRQTICDYLEQNKQIIDGVETKEILIYENTNYVQHMRNICTWGTQLLLSNLQK